MIVAAAVCLAVRIILGADVIWKGLRVLGGIGSETVGTDAAISEIYRVTSIGICRCRIAGFLQADQGAL